MGFLEVEGHLRSSEVKLRKPRKLNRQCMGGTSKLCRAFRDQQKVRAELSYHFKGKGCENFFSQA